MRRIRTTALRAKPSTYATLFYYYYYILLLSLCLIRTQSALGMNAPYLLMNHFSQRYPRVPVFDHTAGRLGVAVAFDFMSVTMATLPLLTHAATLDCLRHIYREEEEEKEKDAKEK